MDNNSIKEPLQVTYPSNSKEKKKVEKVVNSLVINRKKSLSKKFKETFFGDDMNNVVSYIIYDVLVPAAKTTVSEIIGGGVEMLLFGSTKGSRTRREQGKSYVSYNSYYNSERSKHEKRELNRNKSRLNFDDIILESRGEAEEVISYLVDYTIDYGMATVADLYDLVGITSNFTDNKYGWVDLSSANVTRVRDGYLINLPKAIVLD